MTTLPFSTIPANAIGKPEEFSLHISEQDLEDFRHLLQLSKIGPRAWGSENNEDAITREWLVDTKEFWLNQFDWRKYEQLINSTPNFKINIHDELCGNIDLHFAALFSAKKDAIPIILLHGWPGCFMEFEQILSSFKSRFTPETLPYHVIVPSLPGYTLSSNSTREGNFTLQDCARVMNLLMIQLGFGETGYITHGGDVGAFVARLMSNDYDQCKAFHVNLLSLNYFENSLGNEGLTADELEHLQRAEHFKNNGSAYMLAHHSRPTTIGLAISATPLSLLAWVGEKFISWSDSRYPISLDRILGNITLYWFTDSFSRSIWPYGILQSVDHTPNIKAKPMGYSYFPRENFFVPVAWETHIHPHIVRYTHTKAGISQH